MITENTLKTQDITVRKQAEQALERSHAALEQAQALTHLGSWHLDFASQRMEWSQEIYRIHDMDPGTPVDPQSHFPFIHPDDFAAFESAWQATLNGAPFDLTHRIIVQGAVKWVHARAEIQCNEDGQPQSAIGTVQDVTARKQAELALTEKTAALLRAEQQLREVLDTLPVGVTAVDLETKGITYLNECLCRMLGREREEVVGMSPPDFFPAEHRATNSALFAKALRGETAWEPQLPIERRDGTVFLAEIRNIQAVLDGRRCLLSVLTDISERQRQEAALRAAEATAARLQGELRWKAALDAAGHGVWDWDIRSGQVEFSPTIPRLLGLEPAELDPDVDAWLQRQHPDDLMRIRPLLRDALASEHGHFEVRHRTRHRDGGWRWFLTRGRVSERGPDGAPWRMIGTLTDVSAWQEAEARLRESEAEIRALNADLEAKVAARTAEARAASAAKSEFLAHMSHEIRTPLNVVLGLAQVLNRDPLTANQADMVGRIQEAGQSLLGIINDVLDFSRIEAGQLHLDARAFHLETLTAKVASLFGATAVAKGLELRLEPPAAPLGPLLGDALRLEQILFNLTGNAIKFTERGQVALQIHTQASTDREVRLRFAVQDTGIGIRPEVQATLFTPFTQADTGITRRFGGTGLGLSISKRLVELMGGAIGVDSQPGQGSTFWFEVSLPRASAAEEVSAAPPPLPRGPRLRGLRLLAVDDSAMNRDLVERALTLEGAALTLAADGQQAVQYLHSTPSGFDAVLMDVQMPVMDGLTATRLIRQELGLTDLPVLALTAGVLPAEQQAAREAGANEVLAKPLDLDLLVTRLVHHIGAERLAAAAAEVGPAASVATPVQTGSTEVPDIPGIDWEWVTLVFKDDIAFYLSMLKRLTQEAAASLVQARQALASGDRETAARCLHSLKGSAGNLGALTLMAMAGQLEAALKAGASDLETGLADLERQVADLSAASAPWQGATADTPPPAGTEAPPLDAGQLEALRVKLQGRYFSAMGDFEALEPAVRGVLGAAQTAALGGAIRGLRFQEALALLDQALAGVRAGEPPAAPGT